VEEAGSLFFFLEFFDGFDDRGRGVFFEFGEVFADGLGRLKWSHAVWALLFTEYEFLGGDVSAAGPLASVFSYH
jgi:hypothetical protein